MKGNLSKEHQIEYDVGLIEQKVRNDHDLPTDWYGDCYPLPIQNLKTELSSTYGTPEYDEVLNELQELFNLWAVNYLDSSDEEE